MKTKLILSSIVVVGALLGGCSQEDETGVPQAEEKPAPKAEVTSESEMVEHSEKPGMTYSEVKTLTSEVLSVDHEARTVVLADSEGGEIEFGVGPEVRNLDQVSAGDELSVEYLTTVTIELVPESIEPVAAAASETARAAEGDMPGAAMVNQTVEIFEVTEINTENNTFKLKNVAGVENQYVARNPENLTKAKVGDSVVITTTEAMAVGVNKLASE